MKNFLQRLIAKKLDYSTRYHLRARLRAFDYKFLGALVVLGIAIVAVLKLY
jgi:hypothetical protein